MAIKVRTIGVLGSAPDMKVFLSASSIFSWSSYFCKNQFSTNLLICLKLKGRTLRKVKCLSLSSNRSTPQSLHAPMIRTFVLSFWNSISACIASSRNDSFGISSNPSKKTEMRPSFSHRSKSNSYLYWLLLCSFSNIYLRISWIWSLSTSSLK